jgi:hypothetical protein
MNTYYKIGMVAIFILFFEKNEYNPSNVEM